MIREGSLTGQSVCESVKAWNNVLDELISSASRRNTCLRFVTTLTYSSHTQVNYQHAQAIRANHWSLKFILPLISEFSVGLKCLQPFLFLSDSKCQNVCILICIPITSHGKRYELNCSLQGKRETQNCILTASDIPPAHAQASGPWAWARDRTSSLPCLADLRDSIVLLSRHGKETFPHSNICQ